MKYLNKQTKKTKIIAKKNKQQETVKLRKEVNETETNNNKNNTKNR